MKKDMLVAVNAKGKTVYSYNEYCDACGKRTMTNEVKMTCKPNEGEKDICIECRGYGLRKHIAIDAEDKLIDAIQKKNAKLKYGK